MGICAVCGSEEKRSAHGSERVCVPGKNRAGVYLDREIHKDRGWWVQDCSAAMENMLLEATDLGIGSIWLGIYPYEERVEAVKKLFSLPERVMPLGIMALGYAAKEKPANDRYLAGRVHWEQFGAAYTGQAGGPAVL